MYRVNWYIHDVSFRLSLTCCCYGSEFGCWTRDWSDWSSCQHAEVRHGHSRDVMGVTKDVDDGRLAMSELMRKKMAAFSQPNTRTPSSQVDGVVPCVDGRCHGF